MWAVQEYSLLAPFSHCALRTHGSQRSLHCVPFTALLHGKTRVFPTPFLFKSCNRLAFTTKRHLSVLF